MSQISISDVDVVLLRRIYKKGLTGVGVTELRDVWPQVESMKESGLLFQFEKANQPGSRFRRVKITAEGKDYLKNFDWKADEC